MSEEAVTFDEDIFNIPPSTDDEKKEKVNYVLGKKTPPVCDVTFDEDIFNIPPSTDDEKKEKVIYVLGKKTPPVCDVAFDEDIFNIPPSSIEPEPEDKKTKNIKKFGEGSLVIYDLNKTTTLEHVLEVFSKYGEITDSECITKNKISFVQFRNKEDAERALVELQGIEIDGKKVRIEKNFTRVFFKVYNKSKKVMVLPRSTLKKVFSRSGVIIDIQPNVDGCSEGIGFCDYKFHFYAKKAIRDLNGKRFSGYKYFVSKDENKLEEMRM